jgi:hypothetical protein
MTLLALALGATEPGDMRAAGTTTTQPEDIRQQNPSFLVRADVDHANRSYCEGDGLKISVASEEDAYLYVLYKQADGRIFQIFPNSGQLDNRVKARQAIEIPRRDDLFHWVVGPPFGKEIIKVIASKEPLESLADPAFREKLFNPVSASQVKGIEVELGKEKATWTEDAVEIRTYAANQSPGVQDARRFGLFVGIGRYGCWTDNTASPAHRNARRLAGVLKESGHLADMRVCTNEAATLEKIEDLMMRWLPSVSRPGDTVILFFAGEGVTPSTPPRAGLHTSGSYLLTFHFATMDKVRWMAEAAKAGTLPEDFRSSLEKAGHILQGIPSPQQQEAALLNATAISSGRFAHWLQGLAGRQLIIVLDTAWAAGFVESPSAAGDAPAKGPLLGKELARLKDLGQGEIVLLGVCEPSTPWAMHDSELSPMSELLVRQLASASGPVTVEQAQQNLTAKFRDLGQQVNAKLQSEGKGPHEIPKPYLINTCSRPALLKP